MVTDFKSVTAQLSTTYIVVLFWICNPKPNYKGFIIPLFVSNIDEFIIIEIDYSLIGSKF